LREAPLRASLVAAQLIGIAVAAPVIEQYLRRRGGG
jgi:hypothetical protein